MIVIDSGYFCAAVILSEIENKVIEAAPIIKYMIGWEADRVRKYCDTKRWKICEY